jgi:hypothetical protein
MTKVLQSTEDNDHVIDQRSVLRQDCWICLADFDRQINGVGPKETRRENLLCNLKDRDQAISILMGF